MLYLKNFLLFFAFCFFFLDLDFSSQNVSFVPQADAIIQSPCADLSQYPDPKGIKDKQVLEIRIERLKLQSDIYSSNTTDPDRWNKFRDCQNKLKAYQLVLNNLPSDPIEPKTQVIEDVDSASRNLCGINTDKKIKKMSKSELERSIREIDNKIGSIQSERGYSPQAVTSCENVRDPFQKALKELEQCSEIIKDMKTKQSEFTKSCGEFSSGRMQCSTAIMACKMCPEEGEFGDYDCVGIHNKTQCPAKSGEDLKMAKDKREDLQEDMEEIQEEIVELDKDIVSKESDLNEQVAELDEDFMKITSRLERDVNDQKAELEDQLKSSNSQVKEAVAKSHAEVQKEIDNFLQVAHSFENAITKANREYRAERRKIVLECETQARSRLAKYRQRRRAAIRTGSLQISVSDLLRKGRKSFAYIDAVLFKRYNAECNYRRRPDFKELQTEYRQKLRVIEQQKEQYQALLKKAGQKLKNLEQQATQAQNEFVQEYAKKMGQILEKYQRAYNSAHKKYIAQKNQLLFDKTNKLKFLDKRLGEQRYLLRDKKTQLVREEADISLLRAKGVTTDDQESEYSTAAASFVDYYDAIEEAKGECAENEKYGNDIERAENHFRQDVSEPMLESYFGGYDSDGDR